MAVDHPSYLGFYGDVKIYDVVTKEIIRFRHPDLPFVSGVTAVLSGEGAQMSQVTINIEAPFVEGKELLNSTTFRTGNAIEVQLGYHGGLASKPFYGLLRNGGVGLELTPEGLTGSVTATAMGRSGFYSTRQIKNGLREAFEVAAGVMGFVVKFSAGAEAELDRWKNYNFTGLESARETMRLISSMANLDYRYVKIVSEYVVEVVSLVEVYGRPPKRRFVMRGQFDEATSTYPLLSFGPQTQAAMFSFSAPGESGLVSSRVGPDGEVKGVDAKATDTEQKAGKVESSSGDQADNKIKTEDGAELTDDVAVSDEQISDFVMIYGEVTDDIADAYLRNLQDRVAVVGAWNANIVTVGIPDVEPYETIEVMGNGTLFDGIYKIMTVTHVQTVGSWETTLDCVCLTVEGVGGVNEQTVQ